jgi:hypothetical protein
MWTSTYERLNIRGTTEAVAVVYQSFDVSRMQELAISAANAYGAGDVYLVLWIERYQREVVVLSDGFDAVDMAASPG